MSEEELQAIESRFALTEEWTMRSGCSDYACPCHFQIPALVAEIRRLRDLADTAYERGRADERECFDDHALGR